MNGMNELLEALFRDAALIHGVLSDPARKGEGPEKAVLRKIQGKSGVLYQLETFQERKAFHRNLTPEEASLEAEALLGAHFRQGVFFSREADYQVRFTRKGKAQILKRPPSRTDTAEAHDRKKQHLIPEGTPVPWLQALGIMTPEGKVVKARYDKFRQINRYLEFVEDCLGALEGCDPIRIVDFGCGKAYLTFALYDHLVNRKGLKAQIVGLDLKADVMRDCTALAERLGFEGLRFEIGDIAGYQGQEGADLVISLHACDTATDAALAKAVGWGAKVILAVPCCHKELIQKIRVAGLEPMLRYGLLRERFGSIATDTLRALALEVMGYQTQLLEFIDLEHTPKNILIRAVKNREPGGDAVDIYRTYKKTIGVAPGLENAFCDEFRRFVNID